MRQRPDLPPGPYLVVGLARSGRAAALALRSRGEQVIGVDSGAPDGLGPLLDAGAELHLNDGGLSLLERVRTVVKSPGVPAQAPVVAEARARSIQVMGELELGWRMLAAEFIAVTGTNGKTTTVELIGHIHRQAGLPVAVAGNVGIALSGLVGAVNERMTVVCEVSSFQLEDTLAFAPEAAVLLNLTPDHLNRHGTIEAYLDAKLRIFARQDPSDVAVVPLAFQPHGLPGRARRVSFGAALAPSDREGALVGREGALPGSEGPSPGSEGVFLGRDGVFLGRDGVLFWEQMPLLASSELRLRGRHNVENAMAASAVCLARGIDPEIVRAGLRSFAGVPHRLEEVARRDGVLFVNDSKATNVASTLVALAAMTEAGLPVRLILGGEGKGQDFGPLSGPVGSCCRAVYLIGEDESAIEEALRDSNVSVARCGELHRALARAVAEAAAGEVVLLSPGCASFDQFADFEARGERFRELVEDL